MGALGFFSVGFCFPAPTGEVSVLSGSSTYLNWTCTPSSSPSLTQPASAPSPRPQNKPAFSLFSQLPPPELRHCAMAGRGGTARTNGTAASNKICQFKLVLLGESAVGKSSLVLRFVKGQFHEYQESTIGGLCFPPELFVFFITAVHLSLPCGWCNWNPITGYKCAIPVIIAQPLQVSSHGTESVSSFYLVLTLKCFSIYRCWSWRKHVLTSTRLFVWIFSVVNTCRGEQ